MSFEQDRFDELMMTAALAEGGRGVGLTAPNPSVGAVVVQNGEIVGRGYHTGAGNPHAEVEAIADARAKGQRVKGGEIFITLEPCSTTGRTPPCTSAILEAGLRRVVWAAEDPNPAHRGAAGELLEGAGVEVKVGVLAEKAEFLHRGFFRVQRSGLPWVIVKTAMSLDGRLTRPAGEGQWLTGWEAREEVQGVRGEVDAIITSGATARADNPRLNYRGPRVEKRQPLRVVVSRRPYGGLGEEAFLRSDGEATLFCEGSLDSILQELVARDCQTVLVEAGGELVGQFLNAGLVDEWVSYFAPLVVGGPVVGAGGAGVCNIEDRVRLREVTYQQVGVDIRLRGLVNRASGSG